MLLSQITMNFVVLKIKLHSPMSGGQRSQGAKIEMSIGLCSFWRLKRTNHFLTVCFMCCPPPWDHNQLLPPQPLLFRLASTIVTSLLTVRLSLIKMLVMTLVPPGYLGSSTSQDPSCNYISKGFLPWEVLCSQALRIRASLGEHGSAFHYQ